MYAIAATSPITPMRARSGRARDETGGGRCRAYVNDRKGLQGFVEVATVMGCHEAAFQSRRQRAQTKTMIRSASAKSNAVFPCVPMPSRILTIATIPHPAIEIRSPRRRWRGALSLRLKQKGEIGCFRHLLAGSCVGFRFS